MGLSRIEIAEQLLIKEFGCDKLRANLFANKLFDALDKFCKELKHFESHPTKSFETKECIKNKNDNWVCPDSHEDLRQGEDCKNFILKNGVEIGQCCFRRNEAD